MEADTHKQTQAPYFKPDPKSHHCEMFTLILGTKEHVSYLVEIFPHEYY